MESPYLLEMNGVSKAFPGVQALSQVTLKVKPGTVHALMGEWSGEIHTYEMSVRHVSPG